MIRNNKGTNKLLIFFFYSVSILRSLPPFKIFPPIDEYFSKFISTFLLISFQVELNLWFGSFSTQTTNILYATSQLTSVQWSINPMSKMIVIFKIHYRLIFLAVELFLNRIFFSPPVLKKVEMLPRESYSCSLLSRK